jgi:DNA-binding MltR family transcriptional regulator
MENKIISENKVKEIILQVLNEDTSKVRREEYAKVQFKIDELQNSLNETLKEFRKLDDSIPNGLKTISNGRILGISQNLGNAQKLLVQLKEKVKQHKKSTYSQQVDEKKEKNLK